MIKIIKHNTFGLLGLIIPFIAIVIACYNNMTGVKIIVTYMNLMAIGILVLSYIDNKTKYISTLICFTIVFGLAAFIDISYFTTFGNRITISTIYVIMESNINETKEFINMYLKPELISLIGVFSVSLVTGAIYTKIRFADIKKINKLIPQKKYIHIFSLIPLCCILFLSRNHFSFYVGIKGGYIFHKERNALEQLEITPMGNFKEVIHNNENTKETFVVVIGEATTSTHMGIYGYYRQTNPRLSKRKCDLLIYNNVRSPHSYTSASLAETLTLGRVENPADMYNHSLIQLFNSAGFYTYFISNQAPVGKYETAVSLTSKVSDECYYTNIHEPKPDSIILDPLAKALTTNKDKKLIVVHLMGTHAEYIKRYPKEFDVFKTTPKTLFNHYLAHKTINEYDNAVLYNDYIVDQIIELVSKDNSKSYVLYFSDHGEDVYETINKARHGEGFGTEPMFKIPLIIWLSEKYKESTNNLYIDTKRKYNTKDLIYTIADLSGIQFQCFNPQKSIVNTHFKEVVD